MKGARDMRHFLLLCFTVTLLTLVSTNDVIQATSGSASTYSTKPTTTTFQPTTTPPWGTTNLTRLVAKLDEEEELISSQSTEPSLGPTEDQTSESSEDPTEPSPDNTPDSTESPAASTLTNGDDDSTVDVTEAPSTPEPTTTANSQLTTPTVECGTCILGEDCPYSCGEVILPTLNTEGSTSGVFKTQEDHYIEAQLDSRMLLPSETLILSDGNSMSRTTSQTIINCNSNMNSQKFTFNAWSGILYMELVSNPSTTNECPVAENVDRSVTLSSNKIPSNGGGDADGELKFPETSGVLPPETGGDWSWRVPVTEDYTGFGVNITIISANLNAELGDVLYLNPGLEYDVLNSILISWKTDPKEPRSIRFLNRDSFFAFLHLGARSEGQSMEGIGFRLNYSSYEVVTPPPPTESTTTPLPTAHPNVSDTAVVYVGGVSPWELSERMSEFKASVAVMANNYCQKTNISQRKPVEASHVLVLSISKCPETWPSSSLCSVVKFSVPVFTVYPEYELTEEHLLDMWRTENENLPPPMTAYYEPTAMFWWWIGVSFGVLVLIILSIVAAWRIEMYYRLRSYERAGSLNGSGSSGMGSICDPEKHPYQVYPPYMVNLDNVSVTKGKEIFSDQDWGYENRDSYSINEGMANSGYTRTEDDEEDEIDIFTGRVRHHSNDFGSDTDDDDIVQAVGPARQDLIYDTPSVSSIQGITLSDLNDPNSETVL